MVQLGGYKPFQLQCECKRRNLSTIGTPQELYASIRAYDNGRPNSSPPEPPNFEALLWNPEEYLALTQYELQEYNHGRDLAVGGSKFTLTVRLLKDDARLWQWLKEQSNVYDDETDAELKKRTIEINYNNVFQAQQTKAKLQSRKASLDRERLVIETQCAQEDAARLTELEYKMNVLVESKRRRDNRENPQTSLGTNSSSVHPTAYGHPAVLGSDPEDSNGSKHFSLSAVEDEDVEYLHTYMKPSSASSERLLLAAPSMTKPTTTNEQSSSPMESTEQVSLPTPSMVEHSSTEKHARPVSRSGIVQESKSKAVPYSDEALRNVPDNFSEYVSFLHKEFWETLPVTFTQYIHIPAGKMNLRGDRLLHIGNVCGAPFMQGRRVTTKAVAHYTGYRIYYGGDGNDEYREDLVREYWKQQGNSQIIFGQEMKMIPVDRFDSPEAKRTAASAAKAREAHELVEFCNMARMVRGP